MYGSAYKKENCYEGVKISRNAHEGNFCAVNPRHVAIVTESAGGGAFVVIPIDKVRRRRRRHRVGRRRRVRRHPHR